MTEIRVNSVLPIAKVDSVQSSRSGSDFVFSFQSVSTADLGSETSASRIGTSTDSTDRISQTASSTAKSPERTDSSANKSVTQSSSQNGTDFERAQTVSTGSDTVQTKQNSSVQDTSDDNGLQITISGNVEQTVKKVENELSELQNQTVKSDEAGLDEKLAMKQPMLDLDRIIERLENLADGDLRTNSRFSIDDEDNIKEAWQVWQKNPDIPKRAILHNSEGNAPVIDLDRILAGLQENEQPESIELTEIAEPTELVESAELTEQAEDTPSTTEIDSDKTVDEESTAALPQINFDKILESVKGVQDGDEVAPSADRINAAEAENGVKRSETADSDRIAANVGLVWDNMSDVISAAWESLLQTDLQPSDVPLRNTIVIEFEPISEPVQDTIEPDESTDRYTEFDALLFYRFAQAVSQEEKPTTLEELRAKLANAMMIAIREMNDPDKQQEELEEKILEFLLEFLKKMNEDEDEDDKETALDSGKSGDLGILLLIIENMIDEIREARENTQVADSEENVPEIAPTAAVDSVKTEYGVDVEINANKFTDTDKTETVAAAENKTEFDISGASEGLYASVADVNADKTVNEIQSVNVPEAYENLTVTAVAAQAGISKVDANANDDDLDAKAAKVLSKQNHDGTIRQTELPDEFAELRKLIDDMKKTHEDEEEPEEENDDEEKEVGVGGKGVKGDDKSNIISAISVKSSEPGEAAVAKSFSMERSGAKQILSQIATEVLNNMPKEKRTVALVMTLTPENLGKVTLKITEQAGKLNVVVTAHNKETAEILASRMDGLQEALKDSGTQLEKYQVVYGPEQESDARQQSFDGSSKNPYVRDDDEEGNDKDGEFIELLQKAV